MISCSGSETRKIMRRNLGALFVSTVTLLMTIVPPVNSSATGEGLFPAGRKRGFWERRESQDGAVVADPANLLNDAAFWERNLRYSYSVPKVSKGKGKGGSYDSKYPEGHKSHKVSEHKEFICPDRAPYPGDSCDGFENIYCPYGQECCCGGCLHSYECECYHGEWVCMNTDFCLTSSCGFGSGSKKNTKIKDHLHDSRSKSKSKNHHHHLNSKSKSEPVPSPSESKSNSKSKDHHHHSKRERKYDPVPSFSESKLNSKSKDHHHHHPNSKIKSEPVPRLNESNSKSKSKNKNNNNNHHHHHHHHHHSHHHNPSDFESGPEPGLAPSLSKGKGKGGSKGSKSSKGYNGSKACYSYSKGSKGKKERKSKGYYHYDYYHDNCVPEPEPETKPEPEPAPSPRKSKSKDHHHYYSKSKSKDSDDHSGYTNPSKESKDFNNKSKSTSHPKSKFYRFISNSKSDYSTTLSKSKKESTEKSVGREWGDRNGTAASKTGLEKMASKERTSKENSSKKISSKSSNDCPYVGPYNGDSCSNHSKGIFCPYGEECCCGDCSHSYQCHCQGGEWVCIYTDFCLDSSCDNGSATPEGSSSSEESKGSEGGSVLDRSKDGTNNSSDKELNIKSETNKGSREASEIKSSIKKSSWEESEGKSVVRSKSKSGKQESARKESVGKLNTDEKGYVSGDGNPINIIGNKDDHNRDSDKKTEETPEKTAERFQMDCFGENESPYPLRSETSEVIIDFSYNIFIDGWDDLDKALKQFEIEMTRFVADSILACKGGSRRSLRFLDDKHGFGLKTRRRLGESILCLDSLPKDEKSVQYICADNGERNKKCHVINGFMTTCMAPYSTEAVCNIQQAVIAFMADAQSVTYTGSSLNCDESFEKLTISNTQGLTPGAWVGVTLGSSVFLLFFLFCVIERRKKHYESAVFDKQNRYEKMEGSEASVGLISVVNRETPYYDDLNTTAQTGDLTSSQGLQ